jgi:hypothetical protein
MHGLAVIVVSSEGRPRIECVECVVAVVISDLTLPAMTVVRTAAKAGGAVSDRGKTPIVARVLVVKVFHIRIMKSAMTSSSVEVNATGGAERHNPNEMEEENVEGDELGVKVLKKHQAEHLTTCPRK